jgi:hypothetical protein
MGICTQSYQFFVDFMLGFNEADRPVKAQVLERFMKGCSK